MHLIKSFWAINALKAWQSLTRLETVKNESFLKNNQFELTELNTPARLNPLAPVLLLVVRQQLMNFLSRRREAVWRNNPSQGGNVASAEVPTAKWQRENVGESEVGWSETLFLGNRKGVGRQIIQPPFLILPVLVWFEQRNTTYVTRIVYNESGLG